MCDIDQLYPLFSGAILYTVPILIDSNSKDGYICYFFFLKCDNSARMTTYRISSHTHTLFTKLVHVINHIFKKILSVFIKQIEYISLKLKKMCLFKTI